MANALSGESSLYLRQHAHNPVDWLPLGARALSAAAQRDLPLLLSIGYSSCHWCHVMERESFEDVRVAQLMNERFVCVKVDREERPDVDAICMEAVQAMTGQGGWPLNVFLTPEQLPFYGGTYFPPQPQRGMPSWRQVLEAVSQAWEQRRGQMRRSAEQLRGHLAGAAALKPSPKPFDAGALDLALAGVSASFDALNGGFGGAPKFPQPVVIEMLISEAEIAARSRLGAQRGGVESAGGAAAAENRDVGKQADRGETDVLSAESMAIATLEAIVSGGIHDLLGGGFHRYAVDGTWTVPHFEKMLYDNALLARACLRGYSLSRRPALLDACLDTLGWALREMRCPYGGFCSALDADSDGVEGAFYVWTAKELRGLLGADAAAAIAWTGVSEHGNFIDPHHPIPGLNVLSARGRRPDGDAERRIRETLLRAREARVRPQRDGKRIASWNALMISALAEAGALLRSSRAEGVDPAVGERLLAEAQDCADLILERMRDGEGRLLRTIGSTDDGSSGPAAYLEDHAFLLEALLSLYQATYEERRFEQARQIAEEMIERFADHVNGGFFSTASDAEPLIARRKEIEDSPIPSGTSSAAIGLLQLAALTGDRRYERHAVSALRLLHTVAPRHPLAFGHLLQAMRLHVSPIREVAIAGPPGPERDALIAVMRARPRLDAVLAVGPGDGSSTCVPLLEGRTAIDGAPAAYVCERLRCLAPVREPERLRAILDATTAPTGSGRAPSA